MTPGSSVQQGGGWLTPLCSTSTLTHPGAVFILVLLPRSPSVTSLPSLVSSEGLSNDSTVRTASFCAKIELQYWAEFLCSFLETMSLFLLVWLIIICSRHHTFPVSGKEKGSCDRPRCSLAQRGRLSLCISRLKVTVSLGEGGTEHVLTSSSIPGALGIASNALLFVC